MNGMAIWLNGPAGAGKTSLALALLEYIPAAPFDPDEFEFEVQPDIPNTSRFLNIAQFQFFQSLKQHLKSGGTAIVEYTLFDHLRDLEVMHGFRENHIYLIEVFCPLDELKRREATRSDRRPGQTHLQYFLTAGRWISDLTLDSSLLQTEEMVRQVMQHIQTQDPIGAFAKNIERVHELLKS